MPSDLLTAPANDDQPLLALPPPERIQALLFDAARLGRTDIIPALVQAGANVTARDPAGYTPLILSCYHCLLYTSPSPRDGLLSRMPSSA